MVERGGRKRDGKGWKGVGGTEEVELLLIRNPFLGPGANSATHFSSHVPSL